MSFVSCRFDGHVVAKLPFEPFSLIQGLSHRNLMGTDPTDCSFIFLYILCTMSIREVGVASSTQHCTADHPLVLLTECPEAARLWPFQNC